MTLPNLKKYKAKQKIIIILTIFLAIFAAMFYFIIFKTVKDIQKTGQDIIAQKIELAQKETKEKNIKQLNEKLKSIESKVEELDQTFINQTRELEFITAMEEISNQNQVSQKINIGEAKKINQTYKKTPLMIEADGGILNILNYLIDIEKAKYYIAIKSIDMTNLYSKKDENSSQSKIGIKILAETYWQ